MALQATARAMALVLALRSFASVGGVQGEAMQLRTISQGRMPAAEGGLGALALESRLGSCGAMEWGRYRAGVAALGRVRGCKVVLRGGDERSAEEEQAEDEENSASMPAAVPEASNISVGVHDVMGPAAAAAEQSGIIANQTREGAICNTEGGCPHGRHADNPDEAHCMECEVMAFLQVSCGELCGFRGRRWTGGGCHDLCVPQCDACTDAAHPACARLLSEGARPAGSGGRVRYSQSRIGPVSASRPPSFSTSDKILQGYLAHKKPCHPTILPETSPPPHHHTVHLRSSIDLGF